MLNTFLIIKLYFSSVIRNVTLRRKASYVVRGYEKIKVERSNRHKNLGRSLNLGSFNSI